MIDLYGKKNHFKKLFKNIKSKIKNWRLEFLKQMLNTTKFVKHINIY